MAIAVISAALPGLIFAGSAAGCTCAPTTAAESLQRADAAIVGRLIAVEPRGPARAVYRYRVIHVYRGRARISPGSTLSVLSGRDGAGCGLPVALQRHYGLFLVGDGARWASGSCGVISPRRLWQAARHLSARSARSAAGPAGCTS